MASFVARFPCWLVGGREEKGARFFHGNFEVQRADCRAQTGDVMLETLSSPVTSCQGSHWCGGHRYLLGATERTRGVGDTA